MPESVSIFRATLPNLDRSRLSAMNGAKPSQSLVAVAAAAAAYPSPDSSLSGSGFTASTRPLSERNLDLPTPTPTASSSMTSAFTAASSAASAACAVAPSVFANRSFAGFPAVTRLCSSHLSPECVLQKTIGRPSLTCRSTANPLALAHSGWKEA